MSTTVEKATNKKCPGCGNSFHKKVFGYQTGNSGEKKCKPYCPPCTKEKNTKYYQALKNKQDPFYCGF